MVSSIISQAFINRDKATKIAGHDKNQMTANWNFGECRFWGDV